jgi:hypothetical protein
MYTLVRFLKPFTFAGTVAMVTYNFNASPNVEGYLDDALADQLIMDGLAVEVV